LRHFDHPRTPGEDPHEPVALPDEIELLLISAERDRVNELYRNGALKDETRRRLERELDLREVTIGNHQHET